MVKPAAVRWRVRQSMMGGWSSATTHAMEERRSVSMLMLSSSARARRIGIPPYSASPVPGMPLALTRCRRANRLEDRGEQRLETGRRDLAALVRGALGAHHVVGRLPVRPGERVGEPLAVERAVIAGAPPGAAA